MCSSNRKKIRQFQQTDCVGLITKALQILWKCILVLFMKQRAYILRGLITSPWSLFWGKKKIRLGKIGVMGLLSSMILSLPHCNLDESFRNFWSQFPNKQEESLTLDVSKNKPIQKLYSIGFIFIRYCTFFYNFHVNVFLNI